jgi:hypothetical protein
MVDLIKKTTPAEIRIHAINMEAIVCGQLATGLDGAIVAKMCSALFS